MNHNYDVAGLFPVPVVKINLENSKEKTEYLKNFFFNQIQKEEFAYNNQTNLLKNYYNSSNILEVKEELHDIKKELIEALNFTYKEILNHVNDLMIVGSWFNLCSAGGYQFSHTHVNSILSGTWYINYDKEKHSPLYFESPFWKVSHNNFQIQDLPSPEDNKHGFIFNKTEVSLEIEEGDIFVWPSYLSHGYKKNKEDNRLTMSFNCFPKSLNSPYSINLSNSNVVALCR